MNKRWNPDFRSTFQRFVAQIEYSRTWKVLPSKSGFHLLFILPKSSFGRDKFLKGARCEFNKTHHHAMSILCIRLTHHHSIMMLWVRQTHWHATLFNTTGARTLFNTTASHLLTRNHFPFYAPQTKILEGWTKEEMRISKEALFKGESTRCGQLTMEKCFEKSHFIPCSEQKIAQFRTHYLTKESAYVSTQQSGYFPIYTEMI